MRQVHAPVGLRPRFGQRARSIAGERLAGGIVHVALGDGAAEAERCTIGAKAQRVLLDLPRREAPHLPPVGRIELAAGQRGERELAAAFELDVVLREPVVVEARRGDGPRRKATLGRQRLRPGERFAATLRDVEVDHRNGKREKTRGNEQCRHRQDGIPDPEAGHAGEVGHAGPFPAMAMTPAAASEASRSAPMPRRADST